MVYEVDSVLFNCKASGVPIPNISWYFNGAPFKEPNTTKYMITSSSLNQITVSSTLAIMKAEQSDIGTYTCEASNYASSDTSSGKLMINGKDFIS